MGRRKSKEELEELTRTQVLNLQELEKAAKFEKKTSRKPAYFLAILGVFSISLGLCYPSITNMLSSRGGEDREVVSEQRQETVEEETVNPLSLSCTFTKGTIGGWTIGANSITKNSVSLGSDGTISNGSYWSLKNDGSGFFAKGNITWTNTGVMTIKTANIESSVLKNVKITGTVRQPWARSGIYVNIGGNSSETLTFDNVAGGASGGWEDGSLNSMLSWTLNDSGRIMRIANWKFNGETFTGKATVSAPSGKYFFEDGLSKSTLTVSREMVELIGYGDDRTFYGWIVVRRIDLGSTKRYGRGLKVLAQGMVSGYSSGASISYKTFDGSSMSVTRLSEGRYKISFSSAWFSSASDCLVMLTGYGYSSGSSTAPIKATLTSRNTTSIIVDTSDDASRNDGSFMFYISNLNDWMYI